MLNTRCTRKQVVDYLEYLANQVARRPELYEQLTMRGMQRGFWRFVEEQEKIRGVWRVRR